MTVVIDIGCFTYPDADSVAALIEEYHPSHLYGFDANPYLWRGEKQLNGTNIRIECAAAGVDDGTAFWHFQNGGPGSYVDRSPEPSGMTAHTFDLAAFIRSVHEWHPGEGIVLKLDCEGAETPLMEHLRATGTDWLLAEILVEFHGQGGTDELSASMACKVKTWWF